MWSLLKEIPPKSRAKRICAERARIAGEGKKKAWVDNAVSDGSAELTEEAPSTSCAPMSQSTPATEVPEEVETASDFTYDRDQDLRVSLVSLLRIGCCLLIGILWFRSRIYWCTIWFLLWISPITMQQSMLELWSTNQNVMFVNGTNRCQWVTIPDCYSLTLQPIPDLFNSFLISFILVVVFWFLLSLIQST